MLCPWKRKPQKREDFYAYVVYTANEFAAGNYETRLSAFSVAGVEFIQRLTQQSPPARASREVQPRICSRQSIPDKGIAFKDERSYNFGMEMEFEIIGDITQIETIAAGNAIREIARLRKLYGKGRWRKLKGMATVKLPDDIICKAEVHWYEAHGVGRKEFKVKLIFED